MVGLSALGKRIDYRIIIGWEGFVWSLRKLIYSRGS